MFSRKLLVAFLALSLSVNAAPAKKNQNQAAVASCAAPSTIVSTVTVTARSGAATLNNAGSNNAGTTAKAATTAKGVAATTAKGAAATTAKGAAATTAKGAAATTAKGAAATTAKGAAATTAKGAAATTAKAGTTAKGAAATTAKAATTAAAATTAKGAAATTAAANSGNAQTSLTLDPRVIASGFANNGQDVPAAGQVPSLTSTNNFINFCLTVPNLPITNGKQITTGSCNPAPIGVIPSTDNMPSSKFTFPQNFGTIKANTAFTVSMAIARMQTGFFVNAQANYFAAPQFLNSAGQIQGHSHVVIEQLSSLTQTSPTDPKVFAFFKGLNAAASNGVLTADVTAGLPVGVYKLSSINSAANHQPVIVPVAQHGSLDDAIYFSVTADGKAAAGANNAAAGTAASASSAVAAPAASSAVATKGAASTAVTKAASSAAGAATGKVSAVVTSAKAAATTAKAAATTAKAAATTAKAASTAAAAASSTSAAKGSTKNGKN